MSQRDDPIDRARANWDAAGWTDATPGMAVVTSIMRVQQLMLADVERALKPFGLTFARYEVLMLLTFSRRGALPVGKVGERLQVHPASVTNAVDRLQRDGLVTRHRNPADGRSVLAEITTEGRRRASKATALLNDEVFSSLPMSAPDLNATYRLLGTLRHGLGDGTATEA